MAEARCLAVARRLAAQVPQDGLAEKTWKQSKRSYEIESFSKGCLWLRLGVWLWPDIWLHRYHKMVLQRTWKQSKRSYETESFSKGRLWLRLGVWLWPNIWLHRYHKMVLQ